MLLDIHTHHLTDCPDNVLLNCCMEDQNKPDFLWASHLSISIHPWYLTEENLPAQLKWATETVASNPHVLAIGEAGLDKCCPVSYDLQQKAFLQAIRLSEQHHLPLIIHTVRTSNEIITLRRETSARQPWIIHGFRGKKELAISYLRHGFYLSFGEKYQEQALAGTPLDRLLLETDTSQVPIRTLMEKAALLHGMSTQALCDEINGNTNRLFFSR